MTDRASPALGRHESEPLAYLAETLPLPAIDLAIFDGSPDQAAVGADTGPQKGPRGATGHRGTVGAPRLAECPPGPAQEAGAGLARVAKGGVLNLGGALLSAIATLGLTVVVTHNFSRSVAGAFFVAMSLFLIVEAMANLGAYNGTIYFIARLRALNADRRIPAIMRATVIPVLISSAAGALAVFLFAHPLARLLIDGQSADGVSLNAVAASLRALAVALPFAALADTLLGATRGYHDMRPTVVVDRIGRSGSQAIGVIAAALAGSSALLAPLWAVPYLGASAAAFFWLRRIMRRHLRQLAASGHGEPALRPGAGQPVVDNKHGKPNAKGFWRFTGPRSLASVA